MSDKTIIIRFSGDSGDGVQLLGEQLTITAALSGKDVRTQPDFPAEIRAPAGTVAGVSGFQLAMAETALFTAGEELDILVALNPAALKKSLEYLKPGGLLMINEDSFQEKDWEKAKLLPEFLSQISSQYHLVQLPLISLTLKTLESFDIPRTKAKKAKNFYILGLVLWLFDLSKEDCLAFIQKKFQADPVIAQANEMALSSGYNYAMTLELERQSFIIGELTREPGDYRQITGIEAVCMALAALSVGTQKELLVAGYPITPSSAILQKCATLKEFGIQLFQAEDEIAAICSCIGAAFGGALAFTCTSGPGFDLKTESLGLASVAELPLVILDVQRAGASTGLPTKTGQSDLNMAVYGRHGEAPIPVIAATTPADCFYTILEAFRIAIKYMTPVIVLMDSYLANAAEPWKIPDFNSLQLPDIQYNRFPKPFERDAHLARSWNIPGSEGFIHQLGGLEKQGEDGRISYEADNHQTMVTTRANKIAGIAKDFSCHIEGDQDASVLIIAWGSTYGSIQSAIATCKKEGIALALLQLRYLNPLPPNLDTILKNYTSILVAELNTGHLCQMIRAKYLVNAIPITQCNGQAFSIDFLCKAIQEAIPQKETHHDEDCLHA